MGHTITHEFSRVGVTFVIDIPEFFHLVAICAMLLRQKPPASCQFRYLYSLISHIYQHQRR